MKKISQIVEVEDGLEALLDENVLLLCSNYFYTGKLSGVNSTCVLLTEASLVYETGPWHEPGFKDAQSFPAPVYVQTAAIESFFVVPS